MTGICEEVGFQLFGHTLVGNVTDNHKSAVHCVYSALGYGEYLHKQDPAVNGAFYSHRPVLVCRFFRSADYLGLSCKFGYGQGTAFLRSTEQLKPGTVY